MFRNQSSIRRCDGIPNVKDLSFICRSKKHELTTNVWFLLVLLFLLLFCQNVMCKYGPCSWKYSWVVHIENNMHLGYTNLPMPYKRKSNLNAFLVYLFSLPPLSRSLAQLVVLLHYFIVFAV